MRGLDVVVQRFVAVAGEFFGFVLGGLLHVQDRGGVVELGERVDEQFPVGTDLGLVAVDLGHLVEGGVAFDALGQRAEVFVEGGLGVVVEVDEDEALPDLAAHVLEAEVLLVQVEELVFLLDEGQVAFEAVAPGVVLAGELLAAAGDFFAGGSRSRPACFRGGGTRCGRRGSHRRCP